MKIYVRSHVMSVYKLSFMVQKKKRFWVVSRMLEYIHMCLMTTPYEDEEAFTDYWPVSIQHSIQV